MSDIKIQRATTFTSDIYILNDIAIYNEKHTDL